MKHAFSGSTAAGLMGGSWILVLVLGYFGVLFAVARAADRKGLSSSPRRRAVVHSLSLAVLCSSWTYFGAVGMAAGGSWLYVANFLGPILAITFFFPLWWRIAILCKQENVGSIADFLSARYGKSRALGSLVACVAIVGALPYIALQLISLIKAWSFAAGETGTPPYAAPLVVGVLAAFAILFGARRPSLTQHSRGLTHMVALESVVKISALTAVAGLCAMLLMESGEAAVAIERVVVGPPLDLSFLTATMLCMVTSITLPRQFHLSFVALENVEDLKVARWLFPLYFAVWPVAVFLIALAARQGLADSGDPDMLVLALPLQHGGPLLSAFAFLGGISAGAAMVVVETTALSAMISNELVLPWLARWSRGRRTSDAGRLIVNVRRTTILLIHLLAWLYYLALEKDSGLTQLGFTSLAASAQLLPALVGAVVWRRGHMRGAIAGIVGGMAVWLIMVAAPKVVGLGADHLFMGAFQAGILISLALNIALYVGISLGASPRLIDRIQADTFVIARTPPEPAGSTDLGVTIADLRGLVAPFIGQEEADRAFAELLRSGGRERDAASPMMARAAERMLSGAIGAPSARNVIALYLAADTQKASEIGQILDEAAHAVQFSRELLQTVLDGLEAGIGVVDRDARLIAWNRRYAELLTLTAGVLHVGKPLVEIMDHVVRHTATLGRTRSDILDERLVAIRSRQPVSLDRLWQDGRVLRVTGKPLPTGEYLTSIADVTDRRRTERAQHALNEELESRVIARTAELMDANHALEAARAIAERATRAQRRFVAAASHDLLQPLHAARLFVGTVLDNPTLDPQAAATLSKADMSIEAANRLLKALLNLSRLEVGGLQPTVTQVSLCAMFTALQREFEPSARARGLDLVVLPTARWVLSDPDLLRSVLQNYIANALRYTSAGRVVVAARFAEGGRVRLEVRDSGPGIEAAAQKLIFDEFTRLPDGSVHGSGAGLGLAIVRRICEALDHRLLVRSAPGQGSTFAVIVEGATAVRELPVPRVAAVPLDGMRVLCVEDDRHVADALAELLRGWGAVPQVFYGGEEAVACDGSWDAVLADYQLGPGLNGLEVLQRLGQRASARILVTANHSDEISKAAVAAGVVLLQKPLSPIVLRTLLGHARRAGEAD